MKQSRHIEQRQQLHKEKVEERVEEKEQVWIISREIQSNSEMSKASNGVVIVCSGDGGVGSVAQLQSLAQCAAEESLSPSLSLSPYPCTSLSPSLSPTTAATTEIQAPFSGLLRSPNRELERGSKSDAKKLATNINTAQLRSTTFNIKVVIVVVVVVVVLFTSLLTSDAAHNLQLKSNLSSLRLSSSSSSPQQPHQQQFEPSSSLVAITRTKTNSNNYENDNQTKSQPLPPLLIVAPDLCAHPSDCTSSNSKSSNLQIEQQLPSSKNRQLENDDDDENEDIKKALVAETTAITSTITATHQQFNSTTVTNNYSNQQKEQKKENILFDSTKQQTALNEKIKNNNNNYDGLSHYKQKLDKQRYKSSENEILSIEQQQQQQQQQLRRFNSYDVFEFSRLFNLSSSSIPQPVVAPVSEVNNQPSSSSSLLSSVSVSVSVSERILRKRGASFFTNDVADDIPIDSSKVIFPVLTEKQNEELIELLAEFYAHTRLIYDRLLIKKKLIQFDPINKSTQSGNNLNNQTIQQEFAYKSSNSNKNNEEEEERKMKVEFGADEESLMNWLRQKQEKYPSLKNATFELLQEYPNRTIIVCEDGPKILVLPDRRDIVYCYTSEQWMQKLWLDIENSLTLIHYPIIILNILIFLFGTTGNIFVCLSVYRNHQLRNVTNYFIVNLAFADFLVILICLPATVIWDLSLTWFFGTIPCKMIMFLQHSSLTEHYVVCMDIGNQKDVSISVSVLTLTAISIDRYYAICYPLRFKSNLSQAKRIIVLIWIVSLLIMAPNLIYLRAKTSEELSEAGLNTVLYSDCNYDWNHGCSRVFQFVKTILLYLLPFILMFVAHFKILQALKAASAICYTAARLSYSQQQQMMPNNDVKTGNRNSNNTRHVHYSHSQLNLHPQQQQQPQNHSSQRIDIVSSFLPTRRKLDPSSSSSHHLRGIQAINDELKAAASTKDRDADDSRPPLDGVDDDAPTEGTISASVTVAIPISGQQQRGRRSSSFCEQKRGILAPTQLASATSDNFKADDDGCSVHITTGSGNGKVDVDVDGNDIKVTRLSAADSSTITATTTTTDADTGARARVGAGAGQGSANVIKESLEGVTIDRKQLLRRRARARHRGLCSMTALLKFPYRLRTCLSAAAGGGSKKPSSPFPSQTQSNALATDTTELLQKLAEGRIVMENGNANTILNGVAGAASTANKNNNNNDNKNSSSTKSDSCCSPLTVAAYRSGSIKKNNNNNNSSRVVIRETSLISLHNPKQQRATTKRNQPWHPNQSSTTRTVDEQRQLIVTMHNKSKLESRKAAAKMLMTIVILFGICYLPVHLINFLRQFIENIPQTELTSTISMLAHCICYLNSAINPIIYNHMNSVFRAEFKKFLSCLCWLPNNSPNQQHQSHQTNYQTDRLASVRRLAALNGTNSAFLTTTKANATDSPTFAGQAANNTTFVDLDIASQSSLQAVECRPLEDAHLEQVLDVHEEKDQVQVQELEK